MARIGSAELERLKAAVSVAELVAGDGVVLARRGADLAGLCPLHEDREPSLVVTPAKNLWHCFGCGVGGGPIDWVMRRRGISFRHAVELLREASPESPAPGETAAEYSSLAAALPADAAVPPRGVRGLAAAVSADADDAAVLDRVVSYYQASLARSPAALAYLTGRGLADPEAIATFRLGFADRTLGLRLPDKRRREGAALRARLERLGLYRASGHEHFCGSLTIPVLDAAGAVVGLYGRKVTPGLRAGTPLHLYLPGPHRGVWNLPGISAAGAAGEPLIVCEALLDALTFWCAGFRAVTAAYGVDGFTEAHLAALREHGIGRVLIAYDRDEAGDRGAARLAERLGAAGIGCWLVLFPKGMDANAYALKVTPARQSLGLLLRQAVWMGSGEAPPRPDLLPTAPDAGLPAHAVPEVAPTPAALPLAAAVLPAAAMEEEASEAAAKEEGPAVVAEIAPVPAGSAASPPAAAESTAPPAEGPPPPPGRPPPEIEANGSEATIRIGGRRWRVRGLDREGRPAGDTLRVNLMAATGEGDAFHIDTIDLYSAKARAAFTEAASAELGVPAATVKADLGQVLLAVEALLDARATAEKPAPSAEPTMTQAERDAALALLRDPDLLGRIAADFEACGLVGEATNRLVGYLACVSRKLAAPLAVLVQSSSAAGKSSLMDAVLAFVPETERVRYSAITGQALFYMGGRDLRHRILALCEEEGASRAAYGQRYYKCNATPKSYSLPCRAEWRHICYIRRTSFIAQCDWNGYRKNLRTE